MMRRLSVSNTVLLIICLMYLILYVDRVNISTAAPLIKADLDLSNTQLGLVFSAFAYPYALFQLIGGYFGDTFAWPTLSSAADRLHRDGGDRGGGGLEPVCAACLASAKAPPFPPPQPAPWRCGRRSEAVCPGITHSSRGSAMRHFPLIALLVELCHGAFFRGWRRRPRLGIAVDGFSRYPPRR